MAAPIGEGPGVKGPVPYCLDRASIGFGARARLEQLRNAIRDLEGNGYQGLENVFRRTLFVWENIEPEVRQHLAEHLKKHWFDNKSSDLYFPKFDVARIYAEGVLKAVELSLYGAPDPVPIDAWWVVDCTTVKLLNLVTVERGVTTSSHVTLLVMTPRPKPDDFDPRVILASQARLWVTDQREADGAVETWTGRNRPHRL